MPWGNIYIFKCLLPLSLSRYILRRTFKNFLFKFHYVHCIYMDMQNKKVSAITKKIIQSLIRLVFILLRFIRDFREQSNCLLLQIISSNFYLDFVIVFLSIHLFCEVEHIVLLVMLSCCKEKNFTSNRVHVCSKECI